MEHTLCNSTSQLQYWIGIIDYERTDLLLNVFELADYRFVQIVRVGDVQFVREEAYLPNVLYSTGRCFLQDNTLFIKEKAEVRLQKCGPASGAVEVKTSRHGEPTCL
jgi:hypothetical protein